MSVEPHQEEAQEPPASDHRDSTEGQTRSGDRSISAPGHQAEPKVTPEPEATAGTARRAEREATAEHTDPASRAEFETTVEPGAIADPARQAEAESVATVEPGASAGLARQAESEATAEPGASTGPARQAEAEATAESAEPAESAETVPAVKLPPPPLPVPRSSRPRRFGALMLELLLIAVTMFAGWFVWSLRTWARGQTPAKSLLSMRCVRIETAHVANWRTMALREFVGKGLLGAVTAGVTVVVSGVMILRMPRAGLWDRFAGTTVVDDPDGLTL
ncbi:MAG: RDD family protein [Acidimicrobiales bacterium]